MAFWLYGAAVELGPEKFGFCTTLSPRALMVRVLPAAPTHGPAPVTAPVVIVSPSTELIAGVAFGYSLSGRLYPSAKAWVGITGVSMYAVKPGMNGVS